MTQALRYAGILTLMACGDILGLPYETYDSPVMHPGLIDWAGGFPKEPRWSDDTAMAKALAESILAKGFQYEPADAMDRYYDSYAHDNVGYGNVIKQALRAYGDGTNPLECGVPIYRDAPHVGNGALMRCSPLAYLARIDELPTPEAVKLLVIQDAHLTHIHPTSDVACFLQVRICMHLKEIGYGASYTGVVAKSVEEAYKLWPEQKPFLLAVLAALTKTTAPMFANTGNTADIFPSVIASVAAIADEDCYWKPPLKALQAAVRMGGDTDTRAALVGAQLACVADLSTLRTVLADRLPILHPLMELDSQLSTGIANGAA